MKTSLNFKTFLYNFGLIFIILMAVLYGQIYMANVGQFTFDEVFGKALPLWLGILIPLIYIIAFIYLLIIGNKNYKVFKKTSAILFLIISSILFIYVTCLIAFKDVSHLIKPGYKLNSMSLNEKIQGSLNFLMSLLNIFIVFFLIKYNKETKITFIILFSLITLYTFTSIIYSLIVEFPKYLNFKFSYLFNKNYDLSQIPKSFYKIQNVYAHTLFIGIISLTIISLLINKTYVFFFTIILAFFIPFTISRTSIISAMIFYYLYIMFLIIKSLKKHKIICAITVSCYVLLLLLFSLDGYLYEFMFIKINDKIYHPFDLFIDIFNGWKRDRLSYLEHIFSRSNVFDWIFGLGYGNGFLVSRSEGFFFYYHNSFIEYISNGGIFYCLFILIILIVSLYQCIKLRKINFMYLGFFITLFISYSFYSLFESLPIFQNDFPGIVFGVYFTLIPNLMIQKENNKNNQIKTFRLRKEKLELNY